MAKDLAIVLNNGSISSAVVTAAGGAAVSAGDAARGDYAAAGLAACGRRTISRWRTSSRIVSIRCQCHSCRSFSRRGRAAAAVSDPRLSASVAPQLLELLPLIAAAARYAVFYQASAIYLGLRVGGHGDELAQATEYFQIWNELLQLPCAQPELEILTPLLELEPWQVVDVGFQVAAPFDRTWSCVEESSEPCWACRGCRAREAAFQQAGKPDPMRGGAQDLKAHICSGCSIPSKSSPSAIVRAVTAHGASRLARVGSWLLSTSQFS